MPVATATPVLATGLTPMFQAETAPATTRKSAELWAKAYAGYALAGGIPGAPGRRNALADAFERAFNPLLGLASQALILLALQQFWLGMPVPAQTGTVSAFVPTVLSIVTSMPTTVTPPQQAAAIAATLSRITLGGVKVLVPGPAIVPLL